MHKKLPYTNMDMNMKWEKLFNPVQTLIIWIYTMLWEFQSPFCLTKVKLLLNEQE